MFNPKKVVSLLKQERDVLANKVVSIDSAINALGGKTSNKIQEPGQRRLSKAARKRISEAQHLRWAKHKKEHKPIALVPAKKLHWTQQPKNRARVKAAARRMTRARLA